MSFILDALKKVEKKKTGVGEIRVAEEVLGRRRLTRYTGTATLVGIALLSALITAGAMRYLGGTQGGTAAGAPAPTPAPATEPAGTPASEAPVEAQASGPKRTVLDAPPAGTGSPPPATATAPSRSARGESPAVETVVPEDAPVAPAPETEERALVLQGTSVLNGEPVAVINDQRVFVGDRVGGALVISIEPGRVVLEKEGVRIELDL